jgi:CubicO group peptidase (beta-lactamase class C family)
MTTAPDPIPTNGAPDAATTDPVRMGWMQGDPVPPERRVRFDDGSMYRFPEMRWAFSNLRRLLPTTRVSRGTAPVSALPRADRDREIDALRFTPIGGGAPVRWDASLGANFTDGIVVLHRGNIVYERYFGALDADRTHLAWSVTKSLVGTLAASLVAEGTLDPHAPIAELVPELGSSGFADATLRQVLDMTTALDYSEDYADRGSGFWRFNRAAGMAPRPADYDGPEGFCAFLQTVRASGRHGGGFTYRTVNTDVLGWVLRRATGRTLGELLAERIWFRIGAEHDGDLLVDACGTEYAGAGFNGGLRDMARVGEMLRNDGVAASGERLLPSAAIAGIRGGADRSAFAKAGYATLPGWSYRDMWWISHNAHGAWCARGIHGQALYIDPKAEMTIARFASHPLAGNVNLDPMSLPAYHALAEYLLRTG